MTRLAVLASHPVQYSAPLFRELAKRTDLTVYYAHDATAHDQASAGFGIGFSWDVDLLAGYPYTFLSNVARNPRLDRFAGVDTPDLGRRLRDERFDALLLMGWYLKTFMQGLIAAKRMGLPVMARGDSHLDTPRGSLKIIAKRTVYPSFLNQFDAALTVGKRNRAYWQHYGYPQQRMFDAPHCVDNAFFAGRATPAARDAVRSRLGIASDAKVVLFAGKLLASKRPLDVVIAAAMARSNGLDLHVVVAGTGPLETLMRECAASHGVPLHLLGFCNQTAMPGAYAAADVLALPSESETWGLVANEALASGTPVLISDAVGCAPDLVEHLGQQAVFKLESLAEFAEKMLGTLTSPPPARSIAEAIACFDPALVASRISEAAATIVEKRRSAE